MGLFKLKEEVHNRILKLRSIEGMLLSLRFDRLWTDSTPDDKAKVTELIENADKKGVQKWIRDHASIDLGEMSILKLREIGQRLRVPNYSRLDKPLLLSAIIKIEGEQDGKEKS